MNEGTRPFQIEHGSITKRFLIVFLAAAGLLVVMAANHYYVTRSTQRVERETRELLNIYLGRMAIARNLADVTSDVMFLARHNEMNDLFAKDDPGPRHSLAKQFLVFSAQKRKYDQIRLLDQSGMEIVRVNYNDGNPAIIPDDRLQNKVKRYYFPKTWALERGEIFISPFDLNIERGEIERPAKPMVRFSTPMFDRSGRKSGIILVNYLGAVLIRDFWRATANISDHVMLLNGEGYWLSSSRSEDEWGFMYGNDRTFARVYPAAWRRIENVESGQFYNENGMFSFATITPVLDAAGRMRLNTKNTSPSANDSRSWKVVSHLAPQSRVAAITTFVGRHFPLYGTMLALLAGASLLIARASIRHQQAVSEAEFERNFRNLLEQRVKDRTLELRNTQTEKDLVVQHLIQAEKMAAIGTMAAGIGHEINNPLYAILGMAEAIGDEDDTSKLRAYGNDILKHSKEIAKIVRNLSGYVRPTGKQDSRLTDVNKKIDEAVTMATRTLLDDRIEIRKDLEPVPDAVAGPEEIKQVFFNVIRNAVQAVGEEGTLEISSQRKDNKVSVRIRDTGVGIPEENLSKIFDPFFTTKGPEDGEGMGLYIAHQIIKKYAGTISFESRKGVGTVCTIELLVDEKKHGVTLQ